MSSTLLFNKDLWLLSLSFILILLYACYLGMEAFARTAEILFFVFIGFLLLSIFFVFSNSQVDVNNALPVGTDWNKIVKNINARNITIPFGEIIACGALFSYVKESKNFHLKGIITVLLIGCFSSLISFIIIGMLGPQLLKESSYPFIAALAKIYILDIIQRFDIIGVIIFMIGALIKAGVYLLVAKNSIVNLHPKISIAPLLLCFGIIVLSITIYLTKESTFFYFIRFHIVPYYLHLPLQIFIPILIAIILILRKALSVQNKKYTKNEL
jgi:spore germination protein KB